MEELTNVKLFKFIQEAVAGGWDDRTAFNKLRTQFGQEKLPGRNAGDRQDNFVAQIDLMRDRPALLTARLRHARIEEFKADLEDAFNRCRVEETDIEDHYADLQKALSHPGSFLDDALDTLAEYNPERALELKEAAGSIWVKAPPDGETPVVP